MNSPFGTLHVNDFEKGLIIAVLLPVIGYIGQVLSGGGMALDWTQIWHLGLTGFIGYLTKNLVTNSSGKFLSVEPHA